jgi:hypothetical protein
MIFTATNDIEIAAYLAEWMDARDDGVIADWPTDMIVCFQYEDGTGGSVAWAPALHQFAYTLRNATHFVRLMFTPEMFSASAVPILPILHEDCRRMLERVASHDATA